MYAGPGNMSCMCNEGWTGDGVLCVEVNNCLLESRGGCHEHADCTPTEPGQVTVKNIFLLFRSKDANGVRQMFGIYIPFMKHKAGSHFCQVFHKKNVEISPLVSMS